MNAALEAFIGFVTTPTVLVVAGLGIIWHRLGKPPRDAIRSDYKEPPLSASERRILRRMMRDLDTIIRETEGNRNHGE